MIKNYYEMKIFLQNVLQIGEDDDNINLTKACVGENARKWWLSVRRDLPLHIVGLHGLVA